MLEWTDIEQVFQVSNWITSYRNRTCFKKTKKTIQIQVTSYYEWYEHISDFHAVSHTEWIFSKKCNSQGLTFFIIRREFLMIEHHFNFCRKGTYHTSILKVKSQILMSQSIILSSSLSQTWGLRFNIYIPPYKIPGITISRTCFFVLCW